MTLMTLSTPSILPRGPRNWGIASVISVTAANTVNTGYRHWFGGYRHWFGRAYLFYFFGGYCSVISVTAER
jgi:hypothetical protein